MWRDRIEGFGLSGVVAASEDGGELLVVALADEQPEKVHELHVKLLAWREEVDAKMPSVNPNPQS